MTGAILISLSLGLLWQALGVPLPGLIPQGELKNRMKKIPEWELGMREKHIERTFRR